MRVALESKFLQFSYSLPALLVPVFKWGGTEKQIPQRFRWGI